MSLVLRTPGQGMDSALSLAVSVMLHVGLFTVGLTLATAQMAERQEAAAARVIDFDITVGSFASDPVVEDLTVPDTAEVEDTPPEEDVALLEEDQADAVGETEVDTLDDADVEDVTEATPDEQVVEDAPVDEIATPETETETVADSGEPAADTVAEDDVAGNLTGPETGVTDLVTPDTVPEVLTETQTAPDDPTTVLTEVPPETVAPPTAPDPDILTSVEPTVSVQPPTGGLLIEEQDNLVTETPLVVTNEGGIGGLSTIQPDVETLTSDPSDQATDTVETAPEILLTAEPPETDTLLPQDDPVEVEETTELAILLPQPDPDPTPDPPTGDTGTQVIARPTAQMQALADLVLAVRRAPRTECLIALPRPIGTEGVDLTLIGRGETEMRLLADEILSDVTVQPGQTYITVAPNQCAGLDLLRDTVAYPAARIGITLPSDRITSGSALIARFSGVRQKYVSAMIVDDRGVAQDLKDYLRLDGRDVVLDVPLTTSGAAEGARHLLFVFATDTPLSLSASNGLPIDRARQGFDPAALEGASFGLATIEVQGGN